MANQGSPKGQERILLVDDSATQAQRTRWVLEASGYQVLVCQNGTMALAAAADHEPDLILLDLYLPDLSGREVAKRLKADPLLSGIPIIFVTGVFRDVADIVTGLEQGADDYLTKPVEDGELIARVRACLRANQTQRELGRLARLMLTVNQVGKQLTGILDLDTLLKSVVELTQQNFEYPHVHLFLIDELKEELVLAAAAGPTAAELMDVKPRVPLGGDSLAATSARSDQLVAPMGTRNMLHPFMTGIRSGAAAPLHSGGVLSGVLEILSPSDLAFGSNDGLVLQTLADMVGVAVHNSRLYKQMEELAAVDELTGLLNRRTLFARLEAEWERSLRYQRKLSLVIVDVDHFKQVNDQHGHHTGDIALIALATMLRRVIRRVDVVGRLGGDEFLVILPETHRAGALELAGRLSTAGADLVVAPKLSEPVKFTLSMGVANWPDTAATNPAELMRFADEALYRAKVAGRNCIGV